MSGNNCTQVGGALPFSCPIHIENKTHCSLVTAVTLVATGLILFGLSAHLHQGGVLYSGLGSVGSLAFTAAGTTGYIGVLITLACQQCRKKAEPALLPRSVESSPRDSTISYDSVNGSGSIVVHKGPAKPLVYEIDWSQEQEPTESRTGTIIVHPSGSSYHTTLTKTGSGAYRSTQREALAAPQEREAIEVEEGRKETNAAIAQFKETFSLNAQALLASKTSANPSDNPTLDELQLKRLREAKQHIHRLRLREEWGIKRHSSGENIVFEVSGLDGLIFKVSKEQSRDLKEVEEYVRLRQEARQLCRDEGLYMIRIPACSYVEIDGEYVIVEELIEDVYGDYYFQKSLYEWGLDQPELKPYFKELFCQMLVFVCRFQFGDFKYNNIPLNANGRAIFIDLDNWGAEEGLTKGFAASQTDGLLSYLPQEWLDEMIEHAETILGKSIEVDSVRKRVSEYAQWRKEYRGFLAERRVKNVTDPVFFEKESDASPEKLAEAFCELFNEQLIAVPSCDSMVGRRLQVDFDATSSFWKYAIKPRGFTKFIGFGAASEEAFLNNVPRAFELLKARKIIFDFEYRTNATEAVVYV